MIIFKFAIDTGKSRDIFWLGTTEVTGDDKDESDGIYEQLDVQTAMLDE